MDQTNPAAAVRQVESLAELAGIANKEHEAGEGASRKGLEHFRAAGEALLKAKKRVGHGKWGEWLKANVKFSQPQACRYMRVAREWGKFVSTTNLADALRVLTENAEDPPHATPTSDMIEAFTSRILGQMFYIRQDLGGIEKIVSDRDKWDWGQVREGTLPKLKEAHAELGNYIKEIENAAEEDA